MKERRLSLHGGIESASIAATFAADCARAADLDPRAVEQCEIAISEACANIITHGFGGQIGGELSVICGWDSSKLTITLIDSAPPFNPFGVSPDENKSPVIPGDEADYGLHLIREMIDEGRYSYEGGRNHLTLTWYRTGTFVKPADTPASSIYLIPANETDTAIRAQRIDHAWVIVVTGALSIEHIPVLQTALDSGLAQHLPLIIDFSAVTGLTTAAIKTLVKAWQRAREAKNDLVLASVSPHAREILAIIGLDLMFTLAEDVESALRHLAPKAKRRPSKRA